MGNSLKILFFSTKWLLRINNLNVYFQTFVFSCSLWQDNGAYRVLIVLSENVLLYLVNILQYDKMDKCLQSDNI